MEDQKNTPPVPAAEPPKTDPQPEEHMIPKSRFDEVNNRAKEAEAKLAEREAEDAEREKKALEESGKFKELYEKAEAEKKSLTLEVVKRDLIQEAITSNKLHPRLSKMVQGSNEEEIKKSLEDAIAYQAETLEKLKEGKTADDNAGGGGSKKPAPMSAEEWMKLFQEDPKKADEYLREVTAASNQ